jgi:bifunctional non-homologous end joining protein LigD
MKGIKPMLARSATPFSDADWIFEIKWDGTRAVCYVDDTVHFINRR